MAKREVNFLEGSIFKNMVIFCIPIIITNYIQLLYTAADMMIVGKFGSSEALAGVTATNTLINLILNFFIGLSVGVNVIVANRVGANDYCGSQKAVNTSVFLAVITGVIAALIGFFFADDMLVIMNTPSDVLPQATVYTKYYFLGVPGNLMTNFGSSILRSVGDTKRPLYFTSVAGVLNLFLNYIFVVFFRLDAAGVAIATSISNYVSAALILLSLTKLDEICRLDFKKLKMNFKTALDIIKVGVPSGINSSMYSISNTLIQSSVNTFGKFAVSGNGIATNVDNFLSMAQQSAAHATMTFTSQNYGAKKAERLRPILFSAFSVVTIIWIFVGGLLYIFREPFLYLFTNEKEVVDYALIKTGIFIPTFIFGGIMDVSTSALRGLKYSTLPMIVSLMGACGLRILWVYTVFKHFGTLESLYISYPISWFSVLFVNLILYYFMSKKVIRKIKEETL